MKSTIPDCRAAFNTLITCGRDGVRGYTKHVDWKSEAQYLASACITAAVIVSAIFYLERNTSLFLRIGRSIADFYTRHIEILIPSWLSQLANKLLSFVNELALSLEKLFQPRPRARRPPRARPPTPTPSPPSVEHGLTRRIAFEKSKMTLFGYPSKGGVVALSPAYAPDFDFLGLDGSVLTTQSESYEDSVQEDAFSKHILLLGAKWWDSLHRYEVITGAQAGNEDCMYRLDNGEEPEPTIRDKVWVSVAWPSGGGVVVAEFHNTQLDWHGEGGRDYGIPEDVARLGLCRDMDERATMLRERFEGKWYENVGYYEGDGFLNAWTWQCGVEHEGVEKESD